MVIIPVIMLSGGMGAVESQPDIVQRLTLALPSRHFLAFAKAVAFSGAGIESVWVELVLMAGLERSFDWCYYRSCLQDLKIPIWAPSSPRT